MTQSSTIIKVQGEISRVADLLQQDMAPDQKRAKIMAVLAANPAHTANMLGSLLESIGLAPWQELPADMDPDRDWVQGYDGQAIHLFDPQPENFTAAIMIHSLANKCRFNGHTYEFYGVGQHCEIGSHQTTSLEVARGFLIHEGDELYLPDIATPVKPYLRLLAFDDVEDLPSNLVGWKALSERHMAACSESFGFPWPWPEALKKAVKDIDTRMLATEADQVMRPAHRPWAKKGVPYSDLKIVPLQPREAKLHYGARFETLFPECTLSP